MATRTPHPSFFIRLHGKGISPASIPIRAVSEATAAIGRLAEDSEGKGAENIRLLKVTKGSAIYAMLANDEARLLQELKDVGQVAIQPTTDLIRYRMIPTFRVLSRIAKAYTCQIDILDRDRNVLAELVANTYRRIRSMAMRTDDISITGTLQRVGGSTGNRCALRVPERKKLLYGTLASESLGRELGSHLYERVTLHGTGLFFAAKHWEIIRLTNVNAAAFPRDADFDSVVQSILKASGNAWAGLDIQSEIDAMR